ncbi:DEKNAAC101527 [Brettanomyces naardenensis]|uniref:DEKNAAC101527 n=1 Tax=Brettanomyces naardenensis TaxID=13370 RepID=A0A448YIE1_BRENA|nr:DEKNAAC101527 [Brettanomyces naardenensis]
MTNSPKIKSIAIIGGGPSGIAAAYDLSRALKNGKSLYGEKDVSKWEKNGETAFEEIVVFERNDSIGGVWARTVRGQNNTDPKLPALDKVKDLSDPDQIYEKAPISAELEQQLKASSAENPVVIEKKGKGPEDKYQWRSSGAYEGLFTNVPRRYMEFSYKEGKEAAFEGLSEVLAQKIPQYQSGNSVGKYLEDVVEENHLQKYVRLNSNVERLRKLDSGKWELVIRISKEGKDGQIIDSWYRQEFDAVVLGNGATVPSIPKLKNLAEFVKQNEGKVNVAVAKSIKDPKFLKDAKKILFVGSSVSAVDLAQYSFPRDLEKFPIVISRRSEYEEPDWITYASHAGGLINKPEIAEFLPETQGVRFTDGTVENGFDNVIISTGYHIYFPFLDQKQQNKDLTKFYLFTFSIADPTLASLGATYAVFVFDRFETQASALAGVWSGHKSLPSEEDQKKWFEKEFRGKVYPSEVQKSFTEPLTKLALEDRPKSFDDKAKQNPLYDLFTGSSNLLSLFFKLKNNEVSLE